MLPYTYQLMHYLFFALTQNFYYLKTLTLGKVKLCILALTYIYQK